MSLLRTSIVVAFAAVVATTFYGMGRPISAPFVDNVYMEELTWVEVRDHLKRGHTSIIIPTGGVEQNGPHMVLGKHNYVVRETAGRLARRLGNALVAPTITFVPEGDIDTKEGHMAYPGTFSVPDEVFESVLEYAARSAAAHGFTEILFVGDSLGNQAGQESVADRLAGEFASKNIRLLHVAAYYDPERNGQIGHLKAAGFSEGDIGGHAGIRDTSEMLVAFPQGIRMDLTALNGGVGFKRSGVHGDPRKATAEIGEQMIDLKVDAAYRQIMDFRNGKPLG